MYRYLDLNRPTINFPNNFHCHPVKRNEAFIERQEIFKRLDEILLEGKGVDPGHTKIAILRGGIGAGKTAIATEYLVRRSKTFDSTKGHFDAAFWMSHRKGQLNDPKSRQEREDDKAAVRKCLRPWKDPKTPELGRVRWLMIFDDVWDPIQLEDLPLKGNGAVIVTTTNETPFRHLEDLPWKGNGAVIMRTRNERPLRRNNIDVSTLSLSDQDAVQFLRRLAVNEWKHFPQKKEGKKNEMDKQLSKFLAEDEPNWATFYKLSTRSGRSPQDLQSASSEFFSVMFTSLELLISSKDKEFDWEENQNLSLIIFLACHEQAEKLHISSMQDKAVKILKALAKLPLEKIPEHTFVMTGPPKVEVNSKTTQDKGQAHTSPSKHHVSGKALIKGFRGAIPKPTTSESTFTPRAALARLDFVFMTESEYKAGRDCLVKQSFISHDITKAELGLSVFVREVVRQWDRVKNGGAPPDRVAFRVGA